MNLFDNIIKQSTSNFLGTQTTPTVPSFMQPKAPRTSSYVAPNVQYTPLEQPQAQVTQQPIQNDPSMQLKQKYGFNDKDIEFLKQAKQKGYDSKMAFEYITKKKEQEKQNIYKGDESVDNTFMNVVGGAISEIPKVAGETVSFLGKASQYMPTNLLGTAIEAGFSDKTYGQLREEQKAQAEQFATAGQAGKEFVQKYGAYNPDSTGAGVGETITDIGSAFVGPNKAKILKEGKGFVKGILPKTLNLATEGALAGAKYDVATKGEITKEGVGYGAGGNLVFGAGAKLLGKGYNALTSKLPASMTLGGLINPGKLDVVKKSLQMDEGIATPEDVGKWILDRVKPGNKQEIAEQLIKHAQKTKGAVDEALASIPTYYKNPEAKKALIQIRNELEGKVGLEEKLAKIDELLAKPDYTLSELNAVKRELDDMYNLYTKTGDPTAGLKAEGLRNVRANIRGFIENEAEKLGVNVRKLNNETSTARGLADGILRKDSADGVRELLTAFAPSGAGAAIGAGQSIYRGNDPMTVLRDALIGGVATKLATSTTVRTRIASALNKLVPKELSALENYIKSGGKDAIGKKVAEKVIREGRALPARTITNPSDFAKPTEKSIITPQTLEKGIIQESKKGLSPNVKRPNGNTNNTPSNFSNIPVGSEKVQKPIVKPNTIKNESVVPKKTVNTPIVEKSVEAKYKVFNQKGDAVYIGNKIGADEVIQRAKSNGVEYTIKPIKTKITKSVDAETIKSDIIGEYRHIKGGADDVPNYAKGLRGNGKEYIIDGEKAYVNGGIEGDTYYLQSFAVENKGKGNGMKIIEKMIDNSFNKGGTNRFEVYSITPGAKGFWEKVGKKYGVNLKESKNGIGNLIIEKGGRQSANTPKTVTPPSNAKQQVIKPVSSDTIPEGYIENPMTGEIIKKPSWKTGGFIKIPEIGKKTPVKNPLVEEARKYKSAEEFVMAQGEPVYHGSKNKFEQFDSKFTKTSSNRADKGVGTYFTDNKKIAQEYAKDNGYLYTTFVNKEKSKILNWDEPLKSQKDKSVIKGIVEKYLEPNKNRYPEKGLIIDIEKSLNNKEPFGIIYEYLTSVIDEKELSKILNSKGIDGIISKDYGMGGNVYTLFDANKIKTESQLKQIYEQANKSIPVKNPLVEEARKYKSADEFIKAQGHGRKIIPIKGESMGQNTYKLSEVLDNKKLFDKYPELSGINVKFGWKAIGKEKMAIVGKNIVVTKSQYEIVQDTKKLAEIDKKLNEIYKKEDLGTITKEEYKIAEKLQQEYVDIENGKGSSGIRLTDEGMRSLFHEIQHGKQALKGYNVKMQEDFLSKNAIGDSKDYYQNLFEIDARRAEKKYKTVDELIDIYKQAHKSIPVKNPLVEEARNPIKGVNFTKLKGLIENIKSNNGGQKGVLGDFLEGSEMKKIYGDALDTPIYIFDEKHPVFKTAENINKEGTPRAMTAFIEGGKISNKGTPIIAIRGKISVDGLIKTLTEEGMHALQKLKGRKRIGSATAKNFSEYEGNANEINANKGASYVMKIINRK